MFPFVYKLGSDPYSNTSINSNSTVDPVWTHGPQTVPISTTDQLMSWSKFGLGISAISLLGQHQFASNKLGWDYLIHGVRAVEEYSPGHVFRTFQVSHMLSALESPSRQMRYFGPEQIAGLRKTRIGNTWLEHLSRVAGRNITAFDEGFRFENGQIRAGRFGGDVIVKNASVLRSPTAAGTRFQEAYARSLAGGYIKGAPKAFAQPIKYIDEAGNIRQEAFMFIGGKSKLQATKRFVSGYGTSLIERINQLARAPFELPVISGILERVPLVNRLKFDVLPSSGLKTLGKITAKLGILGSATYLAYQELDYQTRKSSAFDNTIFSEGITAGIATAWTRGQLGISKAADVFGLHDYREWQENIAPGSTNISTLTAFPILGILGDLTVGYIQNFRKQLNYRKQGLDLATASRAVTAEETFIRSSIYKTKISKEVLSHFDNKTINLIRHQADKQMDSWLGKITKRFATTQERDTLLGAFTRTFGKVTPRRLRWMMSGALGGLLIAPFIPGALIPSQRPEELEALYSGKKKVAIRKGRWWEFGRCHAQDNDIVTEFGITKKAKDISLKDTLVGSDGKRHKILGIYIRKHQGNIVKITTNFDRNIVVGLTENHIVPVMKEKNSHGYHILKDSRIVEEIEAGQIKVGDFVQVPIPSLDIKNTSNYILELEDFIKTGEFILAGDKILPAQKNWYTKKLQQSNGNSLPRKIELTHRLGRLFGYFLAEGNLSFKNNIPSMIETVHAMNEKWIVDDIVYIVKSLFGITPTIRYKKGKKNTDEGCWIVRICSSLLARIFFELFYRSNRSNDKTIPWWFLHTSYWFLNALILGLWRGDGHQDGKRRVISSCRKQFVDFVQIVLLSQGIVGNILTAEKGKYIKNNGEYSIRYKISWVPDTAGQPGQGYQWKSRKLYVRVIDIKREYYYGEVYDFEVDHPDHLLQAGTFLVHNSSYEGGRVERFQEHWYPRLLARAKEKSIWGEEEPSPFQKWWTENFTYDLEKKFYEERPYPISGTAFEDIPFIGPVLSATVGRFFKPPVLMHQEEWKRGEEVRRPFLKFGETIQPGEAEPGVPISPYGLKGTIGEQIYRFTEMIGLPGFTGTAIKEAITGEGDTFSQETQLESARRMYGTEREYWDREIGGGLGTTELMRRLYPHRRRQIELYNPIRNKMPEWLPGPGEKSPDFLHGDPFTKVPEGETRLPGPGYAALHPELKNVAPSDYPLMSRFAILADVAPYSDKFKEAHIEVRKALNAKRLSKEQIATYREIIDELNQSKTRRQFTPYKFRERSETPIEEILAAANEKEKEHDNDSWFSRTVGSYWETLTHNAETPFEFLTPMSPAHKLIHQRTAVEDYETNQVYGTENAFWGHPIRDFFNPFISSAKHSVGWKGIPKEVQEKRDLEEYFDILKYVKYTRLKTAAQISKDEDAAKEFENKRRETLFGLNPFTYNYSHIFRALPRRDRDYFNAFSDADMEERVKILKMIPENEEALLMSRWKLKDAGDMQKAIKKGLLSKEQVDQAEKLQSQLYNEIRTEGFPKTKDLWAEYIRTRQQGESYPDWYRRTKLLPEKLKDHSLPGPDWVGWSPTVDLEDVKLKIVQQEGKNMYDYDLWPDRLRATARRPMLEQATEELEESEDDSSNIRARINAVLSANNIKVAHLSLAKVLGLRDHQINLNLEEDRFQSDHNKIRRLLGNG